MNGDRARRWRAWAFLFAATTLVFAAIAFWALAQLGRAPVAIETEPLPPPVELPPLVELEPATFAELPGWSADAAAEALPALRATCPGGVRGKASALAPFGEPAAWRALCGSIASFRGDSAALRALLERETEPYALADRGKEEGLLTGYYEPELRGSRRRTGKFVHPLYLDPKDQMVVDLGEFRHDLAGRKVVGMIRHGRFRPYWDRAEIEAGALGGRRLEMLWVDDPVALFFLQIQGSGRVVLPDGTFERVGYAGQNGHDYTAIGRTLIEMGELTREEVSLQSIRAWLRAHPERADEVMRSNRSYVFFRRLAGSGPEGASGVVLTPGRSLAVDDELVPYGVPLWVGSTLPAVPDLDRAEQPLGRLVVSQDTGGAIVGVVRGDLFLGPGREAEELAGRMKQPLRLWLLAPRGAIAAAGVPGSGAGDG